MVSLFQQLCTESTLINAWKIVRSKNSAGGVDGVTVSLFEEKIELYLGELVAELKSGQWKPQPYMRIEIPKKTNEKRQLGLLSVKDKIVQQAIKQMIEPKFERLFLGNSYGYRPNRGHTRAIQRSLSECMNKKNKWILRLDVDNYFDTINHEILFSRLHAIIKDDEIVRLIQLCVKMGVVTKKLTWDEIKEGIPQGAVLSPLLANLYLHSFDQFITTRSKAYVRYADDFIILCESKEQAEKILKEASTYLAKQLKLKLNEPQISETKNGFEFLGITINNKSLSISDKKKEELLQRINSFVLEEGCFTPKNLRAWNGIKIYYGALLPQLSLLELDNALFEKMQSLASSFAKSIPNQSILARSLRELDFLSEDMLLKKVKLHKEIIDIYLVEKGKTKAQTANLQNQNIINQRKREYHKKENEGSELIINTFGAYIGISNQGITVKKEGKIIHQHPVGVLNHITISTQGVSLSSNAIYYCLENKISIDFFDGYGKHAGSILTPNLTECTLWEKQSALSVEKRKELAVNIIIGKLKNQINLIKYYHKYHKNTHLELSEKYISISKEFGQLVCRLKSEISADKDYRKIVMAIEAQGAVLYWDYIRELVSDDKIGFDKREHQGATDIFNSMLNYGYSILYARIWQALLGAKLNPSDSFIHVRQSGKPTFAYDIIELFRSQVVDRVVISLVQKSIPLKMKQDRLDDNTKKILLKGILERLNRYEKYRGEEIKLEQIIKKQTKEIACFIENNSHYKPYIAKW